MSQQRCLLCRTTLIKVGARLICPNGTCTSTAAQLTLEEKAA